jgi:hypothetical protein
MKIGEVWENIGGGVRLEITSIGEEKGRIRKDDSPESFDEPFKMLGYIGYEILECTVEGTDWVVGSTGRMPVDILVEHYRKDWSHGVRCTWCQDQGWLPAEGGSNKLPCTECGGF